MRWAVLLALLQCAATEFYETFYGGQISPAKYAAYQAQNLIPYCAQEIKPCDENEPRRLDHSCNNLHRPATGAQMTPFRRLLPPVFGRNYDHRPSSSGGALPNVRAVRTSIITDGRAVSKNFTTLHMSSLLLLAGDVTTAHDTFNFIVTTPTCCVTGESDPRCRPIYVPEDDVHLRRTDIRCLNMTKIMTYQDLGCVSNSLPLERVNTAPPMLDLSIVYGISEQAMRRTREFQGGRWRSEQVNGKEWPTSGGIRCLGNQLPLETRCHTSPNPNYNTLIPVNVLAILFFRNHNRIARQLEILNPCWDDDKIFREAREINIAMNNHITYYELLPPLLGSHYLLKHGVIYDTMGHVNDYDPKLEPKVSIEFVIAMRWFHTIVDGRLKKYSRKGKLLDELKIVDLTLRTGILPINNTIEGIIQGLFRQATAEVDQLVDPEMGERVLGGVQRAADVVSLDLMKNREAAMPPYVDYRDFCHLPVPKKFDDMLEWMGQSEVDGLRFRYETVEDIDLLAGILAEKPAPGTTLSPTLLCIYVEQLIHFRRADRFWFENNQHPGAFTTEQLRQIRGMTMARFLCDNGDDVYSVQPRPFLMPGHNNEITDCTNIPTISFEPWRENYCSGNASIGFRKSFWNIGARPTNNVLLGGMKQTWFDNRSPIKDGLQNRGPNNDRIEIWRPLNKGIEDRGHNNEKLYNNDPNIKRYLTEVKYGSGFQNTGPFNAGSKDYGSEDYGSEHYASKDHRSEVYGLFNIASTPGQYRDTKNEGPWLFKNAYDKK